MSNWPFSENFSVCDVPWPVAEVVVVSTMVALATVVESHVTHHMILHPHSPHYSTLHRYHSWSHPLPPHQVVGVVTDS